MEEVYLGDGEDAWGQGNVQAQGSSSAGPSEPTKAESANDDSLTTFPAVNPDAVKAVVGEPQKHGEGTGSYVNYLTTLADYVAPEVAVRRRFQDFVWLHRALSDEHPSCILPPLPGKHRMEYITGDRFSPEFIEKRRLQLQAYLDRLTRHPVIQRSKLLRRFLESAELIPDTVVKGKESHVFENLSDALLIAFSSVRKPDERFVEFKDQLQKYEDNLAAIERLQSKMVKIQTGMMETQITGPLTDFSNIIRNICSVLHDKIYREDLEYLSSLKEYIGYCQSVKATLITYVQLDNNRFQDVLRQRDQKQVDFEELSKYLQTAITDRDRTLNPQRGGGGLASFLNNKMQELKGVDQEKARQQKLIKLASKINELQEAVEISNEVAIAFSKEVAKEIDFFQSVKLADWKQYTQEYSETQIEYYQKSLQYWEQIIPVLENIPLDPPDQPQA
ncbi:intercellular trafficking and secretion [Phlyctochytrium planicorne]|nr:intercellular trafficking and secretion [Phlyctochytrium planicorne]